MTNNNPVSDKGSKKTAVNSVTDISSPNKSLTKNMVNVKTKFDVVENAYHSAFEVYKVTQQLSNKELKLTVDILMAMRNKPFRLKSTYYHSDGNCIIQTLQHK